MDILVKNYPHEKPANPKTNNKSTHKIALKHANYELFDLIKNQAKLINNRTIQSFWAEWKNKSNPNHLRYDGNIWNRHIQNNYKKIKNITQYILKIKKKMQK